MPRSRETTPSTPEASKEEKLIMLEKLESAIADIESTRTKYAEAVAGKDTDKQTTHRAEYRKLLTRAKKLQRTLEGKHGPEPITAAWKHNDESGKEIAEEITLDVETSLDTYTEFYTKHSIELPPDFRERIAELWDAHRAEIVEAIESRGYNDLVLVPGGLTSAKLHTPMTEGYVETYRSPNFESGGSFSGVKEDTTKTHLRLLHRAHNLSDHPVLKETRGKKNDSYGAEGGMTLADYLIYQRQYFEATGKHLDVSSWTWLPGSKSGSQIVGARWGPDGGRLYVGAGDPGGADDGSGCRLSRSFSSK